MCFSGSGLYRANSEFANIPDLQWKGVGGLTDIATIADVFHATSNDIDHASRTVSFKRSLRDLGQCPEVVAFWLNIKHCLDIAWPS